MKSRIIFISVLFSVLSLTSCFEDDIISNSNQLVKSISITGQDFQSGEVGTKAAYTVDGTGMHFSWTEGDTVGIYPVGGDQVAFPISSGEGSQTAQFDGGAWALRSSYSYAAYYPFSMGNYHVKETGLSVNYFGQVQNGNSSLLGLSKYDFQASEATAPDANGNVNIELKHLGCFVRFQLTMPVADSFKSFSLKSDKGSFITSGYYDLTSKTLAITPTAYSKSITVKLVNTYTTDDNKVLTVYAMIAPSDLRDSNITITLTGTVNLSYSATVPGKDMMAGKAYSYVATVKTGTTKEGDDIIWNDSGTEISTHDYVDLGLSVLWATQNVGATTPDEIGDYYAWGEVETYYTAGYAQSGTPEWKNGKETGYSWDSYRYGETEGNSNKLLKYNSNASYGAQGYVDSLTILELEDDVASVRWGGDWRMPTADEFQELISNCEWTYETRNGLYFKVRSKVPGYTDKFIYLPATGERCNTLIDNGPGGYYWTSSVSKSGEQLENLYATRINIFKDRRYRHTLPRNYGCAIRPVKKKKPEYVDLGLSVNWATFNVGATKPEDCGDFYAWGEVETKSDYSWASYKWCEGSYKTLTKYNNDSNYGIVDNKIVLDLEDDVAHEKWGGDWRMPTKEELDELLNNCTWTQTELNGVEGYLVTSNRPGYTDRSIFIPKKYEDNGKKRTIYYWSNTSFNYQAYALWDNWITKSERDYSRAVRPVQNSESWFGISSISLSKETTTLVEFKQELITAIIMSGDFEAKYPIKWTTSDKEVADVSEGWIIGLSPGTALITADCYGKTTTCAVTVIPSETPPAPEYVDLGLSVKWATFNVGAYSPEDFGDYYAWGEIEPYYERGYAHFISPVWKSGKEKGYSEKSYKYCNGSYNSLTKYNTENDYGYVDNKTTLELADDVAHVKWGGNWRIPTRLEFKDLKEFCTWTWTTLNGIEGYRITSNKTGFTDKSIFLPSSGYMSGTSQMNVGYYWTSNLAAGTDHSSISYCITQFASDTKETKSSRFCGLTIRPVWKE